MLLLKNILPVVGMVLLLVSLLVIRRLISHLPDGKIKGRWCFLQGLVCLFLVGYGYYAVAFGRTYGGPAELIVPVIFFFGAVFVLLVCRLALETAKDLKRVFVLEQENTIDCLTGVNNRRYLERRLKEEFSRVSRYGFPLSLVMLDIDHFKQVNDRWGHHCGDQALKKLASLMRDSIREADSLCRYGGEEFLLVLPHTKKADAIKIAEKLRQQIEHSELFCCDTETQAVPLRVTVSMGVADHLHGVDTVQALLDRADKALYRAKSAGRNRVICWDNEKRDSGTQGAR